MQWTTRSNHCSREDGAMQVLIEQLDKGIWRQSTQLYTSQNNNERGQQHCTGGRELANSAVVFLELKVVESSYPTAFLALAS